MNEILERYARGELSAQVTLMELVTASEDLAEVERAVQPHHALRTLFARHREGCARLIAGLHAEPARGEDVLAYQRALFDGWVARDEETSVAFYSLGSAELLELATREILDWLRPLLHAHARVLDLGCGIGRIAAELAPLVAHVTAIDISQGMVDAARRRCAQLANVHIALADGSSIPGADTFDLILAVDSFPYIVDAGLAARMFDECTRCLAPEGTLVVLNYAYSSARPAPASLRLTREARPFTHWNGRAFVFTR